MSINTMQRMEALRENRKQANQWRELQQSAVAGAYLERDGVRYLNVSSNDYLGLSQHPEVLEAAKTALEVQHGAGASRLLSGNHDAYAALESRLAAYKNTEAALVFGSGYAANISLIPALVGKGDVIIADKDIHACMIDGAQLSNATLKRVKHNDINAFAAALKELRGQHTQCLILTETVFSMDGTVADIEALLDVAEQHDAWLLSDDAHGLGVLPPPSAHPRHIQMGTFSKAAGGYGGYVCCTEYLREYFVNAARSLVFSTALPPSVIAGNEAALALIEQGVLTEKLQQNIAQFEEILGREVTVQPRSAIIAVPMDTEANALQAAERLKEQGILASVIRPPTVAPNNSCLRITLSALHNAAMIEQLANAIKEVL